MDMRLPTTLIQKYMLKAAEFYIGYVTRGPSPDVQIHGNAASSSESVSVCCRTLLPERCLPPALLFQGLKRAAH